MKNAMPENKPKPKMDCCHYFSDDSCSITSVASTSDGKKVVIGSVDKSVRVWEVESGKELKKYEGHRNYVSSVAFPLMARK